MESGRRRHGASVLSSARQRVRGLAGGVAAAVAAAWLVRDHLRARRLEREVAEMLPLGPGGVIVGAEPETLVGSSTHAVLLVHGFGDTPQTMRELAHTLHDAGWSVELCLLPGHGRTLQEFGQARAADWIGFVRDQVARLHRQYAHVSLVGLSMGAALCTIVAAEDDALDAVVLLSPYLSMPTLVRRVGRLLRASGPLAPFRRSAYGAPSIRSETAASQSLGFGVVSGRLMAELLEVTLVAQEALPHVAAPTLYMAARLDNRVPAKDAVRNWRRLGARERTFRWLERSGHIMTVDSEKYTVFHDTLHWLVRHSGITTAAARTPE